MPDRHHPDNEPIRPVPDPSTPPSATGAAPTARSPQLTLQGLSRLIDRTLRRVEQLDARLSGLAQTVTDLALHHSTPPAGANEQSGDEDETSGRPGPAGPGARSWLLADDPALADADLSDLSVWLWQVYLWWPDACLSSCWLWHPEVIEELWCLRVAHHDAYTPPTRSSLRVADWHERQRPGVAGRVGKILRSCELNRHIPFNNRPVEVTPPGPPALARHSTAVAAVWTAGARLPVVVRAAGPEPSPEQLAEAEAYQRALYRSRR